MVKAYLRYELSETFGVVSSDANVVWSADGRRLIAAALENVCIWNVKQATLHKVLVPPGGASGRRPGQVTALALDVESNQLAVGHIDGSIRLWNLDSGECAVTLSGHKSAVSCLRYGPGGALLASGGQDTDVILWDTVAEAGLYRLRAHRDQVTDLAFVLRGSLLLTCSKDGTVKAWELDTQHCCQTVACATGGGVWAIAVDSDERLVAVGGADAELRLYELTHRARRQQQQRQAANGAGPGAGGGALQEREEGEDEEEGAGPTGRGVEGPLVTRGSVRRSSGDRAAGLAFVDAASEEGERLLYCQGAGRAVEVFRVRSDAEAARHIKRRRKRRKEKAHKAGADGGGGGTAAEEEAPEVAAGTGGGDGDGGWTATDKLAACQTVRSKAKIRSAAATTAGLRKGAGGGDGKPLFALALGRANNTIEVWEVAESSSTRVQTLEQGGHRSDVRAVAMSSDDSVMVSCSNDAIKVWNPRTGVCLRSAESGYGLSAAFAPGNRHVALGTKAGDIEVFDISAGSRCSVVEAAHGGAVWSLAALPDGSGFVSGGADHEVKFWEWALEADVPLEEGSEGQGGGQVVGSGGGIAQRLTARHARTLKMTDDVLCVRVSPDGKLLAVALLDATVKVFFADSLKFFLSLYGHKLPVLAMDISSDGRLLVTGSADKNIRIWGLDFGDCHRSLFAHGDSVMAVAFVRNTHYVFTAGKDRVVKYWDVDKFELLLELHAHAAEVWALAVASTGDFIISGSHDRSLRRWERTDEPFFVEEERERRLETLFEADLEAGADGGGPPRKLGRAAEGEGEEEEEEGGTAPAGRRTLESLGAADALVETIDLAAHEAERMEEYEAAAAAAPSTAGRRPLAVNPLMLGLSPADYVLRAVRSVKPSDVEQALLLLPFPDALRLLSYLAAWLAEGSEVELCCRVATLLLRIHQAQLGSTPSAREPLLALQRGMRGALGGMRECVGYNLAALAFLKRQAKERQAMHLGDEADSDGQLVPVKRPAPTAASTDAD